MNMGFVIAGVFLAMGIGIGIFVVGYQSAVLAPLAEEEMVEMSAMNCEEIEAKAAGGLFWSVDNYEWAAAKASACKKS